MITFPKWVPVVDLLCYIIRVCENIIKTGWLLTHSHSCWLCDMLKQ